MVVLMLFGLFLEAYMHDFNLVYITLFFVFSVAFTAGPLGVLNLGNLKGSFEHSHRFFAHQQGKVTVKIVNNSSTPAWSILLYGKEVSSSLAQLKGKSHTLLHLDYTPSKRGSFVYDECYLESRFPISTARLTLPIDDSYQGLAYPQPKGKSLEAFLNQEETHYGEEKEFDGLSSYDGSQKLSHIHWASVAKGELSVKTFVKETQTPNLVFDFYKAGKHDEARLSQLCLWVLACEKKRLSFAIKMPRQYLSSQKESIDEILSVLAVY
jgi:uncharacterized protein (DUF58 family)